jgi:protocatechuate 3,4-dioxygenase beta subunit
MRRAPSLGFLVPVALSLALAASAQELPRPPARKPASPGPAVPSKTKPAASASRSRPAPVTSLDVAVFDPAGKPVEAAFVVAVPVEGAYRSFGSLAAEKVRSNLTSRDGKARLDSLPPGPWNVSVHARGFVAHRARRVASGPLAVRLEKGGAVTGVVAEADGNGPVAGVRVFVDEWLVLPRDWEEDATRNETTTDAAGRFRLEGIGRRPVTLAARAPGFARAGRQAVRAGDRVELFLFPGSTLSGTVRDEAGRPVKGAVVRAEGGGLWSAAPPAERTDAQGAFVMSGVEPGDYVVVAREGARAPAIAAVVVEPEGDASVPLTLSDGGFATGRIVDEAGRPLAGRVRAETFEDRGLPAFASDVMMGEAKADGQFALGPLPPGTLGLAVTAPRHASRRVEAWIPARGRTADLGDVALETGLSIRGRVADRDGNGIGGAALLVSATGGDRSQSEATSEADGAFVVGGLKAGSYQVRARAEGYAAATARTEAGGEPLEIVMEAGGQVAGTVVDTQGQPLEEARVQARAADTPSFHGERFYSAPADEGGGRFVLRDVQAGTYDIEAQATGYGTASVTNVRVAPGRTTSAGTITLGRGGVVRGSVVDSEGERIPGAEVYADRDTNTRTSNYSAQTDSTGAFEMRGLPTGKFEVRASHPSFAPGKPASVEVDPDKEPVPARIVLVRGGRLEGHVRHRDGRPFVEGRVMVSGGAGFSWPEPAGIGDDGSFVADHLSPGTSSVTVMTYASGPYASPGPGVTSLTAIAAQEVEVREGETTTLDVALRDVVVAGRVTRGGQPAPGIRVAVRSGPQSYFSFAGRARPLPVTTGPPHLAATTREDGSYELVVFSPGPAGVGLQSATSAGQACPGRQVTIPDVERYELDLEISDTAVSGIVVAQESGEPVREARLYLRGLDPGVQRGAWGSAGADGRFTIAAEPGEYRLEANAPGRMRASLPVSVGPAGAPDLRVEMERGLAIVGRLQDASGRPAGGYEVGVTAADDSFVPGAEARADGSFRIEGLNAQPHVLAAGSPLAGYAVRGGVTPGEEPVVLTLRPGGRIAVRVVGADGRPVREAYPMVETVDGLRVELGGLVSGPTDAAGTWDLAAPAGSIGVVARHEKRTGKGTVNVRSGETTPLTIVLQPEGPKQP